MIKYVKGYQMIALENGQTVWTSSNVWQQVTDVLMLVNRRNKHADGKRLYGFREVVAYE
ncbi:hypothetical protein [Eupransor demetentiae]|uniref:hypothetical protein n=1 Tax=Eupransor demetentiae TaxID=3109584 RepID=UPI0032E3629F